MRSRIVKVRVYVAKGTGSDSKSVSRTFETSVAIVFMRMERKRRRSRIITTIAPPKPAARRVKSGSIQHQSQPKNTRSVHQGLQTKEGVRPIREFRRTIGWVGGICKKQSKERSKPLDLTLSDQTSSSSRMPSPSSSGSRWSSTPSLSWSNWPVMSLPSLVSNQSERPSLSSSVSVLSWRPSLSWS